MCAPPLGTFSVSATGQVPQHSHLHTVLQRNQSQWTAYRATYRPYIRAVSQLGSGPSGPPAGIRHYVACSSLVIGSVFSLKERAWPSADSTGRHWLG